MIGFAIFPSVWCQYLKKDQIAQFFICLMQLLQFDPLFVLSTCFIQNYFLLKRVSSGNFCILVQLQLGNNVFSCTSYSSKISFRLSELFQLFQERKSTTIRALSKNSPTPTLEMHFHRKNVHFHSWR